MIIEYNSQKSFQNSIDIVDIGNTCLRCTGKQLVDYYIVVKSSFGKVNLLKFGPVLEDNPILCDGFFMDYKKFDFKEARIIKEINTLINDPKKEIDTIVELTDYEGLRAIPNTAELFLNEEVD